MFAGEVPYWIGSLPVLSVLSLKKNMLNGSLPDSLSNLDNLRVLELSNNYFRGEIPDLSRLTNLQVLDLEDNAFGPKFPLLGNKLISLVLSKNKFRDGLPAEVTSYYQLQRLDLSNNKFVGPFPQSLFVIAISNLLECCRQQVHRNAFRKPVLQCRPRVCGSVLESNDWKVAK
ncbi:hypothetical protein OIU76_023875, partial [Salix suchowensis]